MHLVFPSNLAKPLPLISPRYYSRPKRNKKKKWVCKRFSWGGGGGLRGCGGGGEGGVNMVHYGHSENGEWQRLRAGKMKQILRSDLLLEQSR